MIRYLDVVNLLEATIEGNQFSWSFKESRNLKLGEKQFIRDVLKREISGRS
jgi:hypothetical protein